MATRPSRRQRLKLGRRDRDATTDGDGDAAAADPARPGSDGDGGEHLYAKAQLEDPVVVAGYSGAGKATAMGVFEEAGYFCVDILPPEMIRALVELFVHE